MTLINDKEVARKFGFSRSMAWRLAKENQEFPQPISVHGSRSTRWIEEEVDDYIRELVKRARGIASVTSHNRASSTAAGKDA